MVTTYKISKRFENLSFDSKSLLCLLELEEFLKNFNNDELKLFWSYEFNEQRISVDTLEELFQNACSK